MLWLESLTLHPFLVFTLVLGRVSGLVITAPIFGGKELPMQVRGLLAVAMALLFSAAQGKSGMVLPNNLVDFLILMAGELLIGMTLGLGIMILLSGVQLAGQVIAQMSGMSLADVLSPGVDAEMPLFSNLLNMTALAIFVVIGGHRILIDALLGSFQALPVGTGGAVSSIGQTIETLLSESFALGIRASAPAMIALLLATLVLGLISRTLPQLNILVLGFGINALVTLAVMAISIGAIGWLLPEYFDPAMKTLLAALRVHQ